MFTYQPKKLNAAIFSKMPFANRSKVEIARNPGDMPGRVAVVLARWLDRFRHATASAMGEGCKLDIQGCSPGDLTIVMYTIYYGCVSNELRSSEKRGVRGGHPPRTPLFSVSLQLK